ncbi:MAG TPA: hypothetical protein VGQ86_01070 [Candidatus Limnocylindria bacterium]|jgi:uncharacterized cupredoxin-like copper-binding protein|nr:hypothetical protein [Candidatus Limnocylindria bacterium]
MRLPLAVLLCLAVTAAACAAQAETIPPDVDVAVQLKEYKVELSVTMVKVGKVRFGVKNAGTMEHEFELIKTDLAVDKIPVDFGSSKAKEDGLVKQVKSIAVGKVSLTTADLAAGSYVIICNVAGHYQLGMRAALTVQ